MPGERQVLHQSPNRGIKTIWGTPGHSASRQSLGRPWSKSSSLYPSMDGGTTGDVVSLVFSKVLDMVCHSIFASKLGRHGLRGVDLQKEERKVQRLHGPIALHWGLTGWGAALLDRPLGVLVSSWQCSLPGWGLAPAREALAL